ncbi:hypothetical protein ACHAPT_006720 [Fusarium lateritium]
MYPKLLAIVVLAFYISAAAIGYFSVVSWGETVFVAKNVWGKMVSRYHTTLCHQDPTNAVENLPKYSMQGYVNAILEPEQATVPRLKCPVPDASRYKSVVDTAAEPGIDYIFAVRVVNNLDQLPTLIGGIIDAIRFLGPDRCALTIINSGWKEEVDDVLTDLRGGIEPLGATYNYTSFAKGYLPYRHRNQAIGAVRHADKQVSDDATIVFLDKVDICSEDLLELILQRKTLGADMTCGMLWSHRKSSDLALFKHDGSYRDMKGEKFGSIRSENWNEEKGPKEYFWKSPSDQARFNEKRPFQVFSCWGGAAAFTASTFTRREQTFRLPLDGVECSQSDTRLFCKDMWFHGRGKIAVVPSVNVANNKAGKFDIKKSRGYTSDLVQGQDLKGDQIAWVKKPPKEVFCSKKNWEAWDEGLPLDNPWDEELEEGCGSC